MQSPKLDTKYVHSPIFLMNPSCIHYKLQTIAKLTSHASIRAVIMMATPNPQPMVIRRKVVLLQTFRNSHQGNRLDNVGMSLGFLKAVGGLGSRVALPNATLQPFTPT